MDRRLRAPKFLQEIISYWAGRGQSEVNSLIGSTAKWAGLDDQASKKIVSLSKALVGDTILKRGRVSVDYGPRRIQLTPRKYLREIKDEKFESLCINMVEKVVRRGAASAFREISNQDLERKLKDRLGEIDENR